MSMTDDDRELLESVAVEIAGELRECDLIDAEAVYAATIPVPVVEIEYPDCLVTLTLSVYRYTDEDR